MGDSHTSHLDLLLFLLFFSHGALAVAHYVQHLSSSKLCICMYHVERGGVR